MFHGLSLPGWYRDHRDIWCVSPGRISQQQLIHADQHHGAESGSVIAEQVVECSAFGQTSCDPDHLRFG
jgi:hypothetical protein